MRKWKFICPSHQHQRPDDRTSDRWIKVRKDRVCSYCGSWHPDEFLRFLADAVNPDLSKHYIEQSTKGYKDYVRRPDVRNAGDGAIKFYKWHLPEDISEETQKLYREAVEVSFRKSMRVVDDVCLNLGMGVDRDLK